MSDSAARAKRRLLPPRRRRGLDESQLREKFRTENWDAEDLVVRQVQLAGEADRQIGAVKVLLYDGGELVWGDYQCAEIERLVRQTIDGYELADGFPAYLDFPLQPMKPDVGNRYERVFCVVVLGPRLAFVERAGCRYVVKPIADEQD